MRKWFILSVWLPAFALVSGQPLTIQDCWSLARDNYPLLKGKESLIAASQLKVQNVKTFWLPTLELVGQATLQSDVPHVADNPAIPFTIPSASKDQYKVALDVSQIMYDGGRTRIKSQLEEFDSELQQTDIETQYQQIRELVTQLFFTHFILEAQKSELNYINNDLTVRFKDLQVAYESGVVLKSAISSLKVEQLRLQQRLTSLVHAQKQVLSSLSLFIGKDNLELSGLSLPSADDFALPLVRAEYDKFNLLQTAADTEMKLQQRNRQPVLMAFGQAGYGNPSYNMLKDEFDTFWMVGVRLKWTPWDWKQSRRLREAIQYKKQLVDYQRESFDLQQKRQLIYVRSLAEQYLEMIDKDEEIIELQMEVTSDYRSKLKNGAITSSEYIAELNAEARARLDRDVHQLQYLQSLAQQQQVGVSE